MKILHVESGKKLYGGALQVKFLIEGLQQRGIDCVLACASDSEISRQLPTDTVRTLPMGGDLDVSQISRLQRLIQQEQPQLVHVHSRRGADLYAGLAAKRAGVPAILTRRVDNREPWPARLKFQLYRRVICISQAIRKVMQQCQVAQSKLRLVHSAVDIKRYQKPCDPQHLEEFLRINGGTSSSSAWRIVMAAQMIERKGHQTLMEALPQVFDAIPETEVYLLGKGRLLQPLRQQVIEKKWSQKVILPGFVDNLEELLPCFNLLVHPASMEGLGVILLQASAAGLPMVAAEAGGIPEVVVHRQTGLLIPPKDANALAAAIIDAHDHAQQTRQRAENARQHVQQHFSIEAMVEGNLAVYREILGN